MFSLDPRSIIAVTESFVSVIVSIPEMIPSIGHRIQHGTATTGRPRHAAGPHRESAAPDPGYGTLAVLLE